MIFCKSINYLDKVFMDKEPTNELSHTSILKGEMGHFQIAIMSDINDIVSKYSYTLEGNLKNHVKVYLVGFVPSKLPVNFDCDDYIINKKPGLYPDVLYPLDENDYFNLSQFSWESLFIETDDNLEDGNYELTINIIEYNSKSKNSTTVKLTVINKEIEKNIIPITHWIYVDCISDTYNVNPFSREFYDIFDKYIDKYVKYGSNMILTPIFTYALNVLDKRVRKTTQLVDIKYKNNKYLFDYSKLDYFIDFCLARGIKYFEMSHLFTQWGALNAPKIIIEKDGIIQDCFGWNVSSTSNEYIEFLKQFLPSLCNYFKNKKLDESKVYFHISDEPSLANIELYSKLKKIVKPLIGKYRLMDAMSNIEFADNGSVDIPVVKVDNAHLFKEKEYQYWIYYCCEHDKKYVTNRFMGMPLERERILGIQLYLNDVQGFLHWGFNFYYTAFSEKLINPFAITDCDQKFPSGDAFLVYPDIINKDVFLSLRLTTFYDSINDYYVLKMLEKKYSKQFVIDLIKAEGVDGFSIYPHSSKWLIEFRQKLNSLL